MQIEEIYDFIARSEPILLGDLNPNADLHDDLGITGDDFFSIMRRFEQEFSVDMREYRWYFHHTESDALGFRGLFKNSPSFRVPHIPVTPRLLLQAVTERRWPVEYPEHDVSGQKFDITIDRVIALALVLLLLTWLTQA
ncbi:MAG: DUF1493 family protein [Chromatiales bacterium]|jgi:hypothetical protein